MIARQIKEVWNDSVKHPKFDVIYRYHGDDGILHYLEQQREKRYLMIQGKLLRVIGITQEITKQQKIENELRQKEAQLHEAYELTNIGAWSYDFKTDKLVPSDQLKKIWTPPKKNIKKAFIKSLHPDDQKNAAGIFEDIEKHNSYDCKYRIIGDDGNIHYFLCRSTVERNETGNPLKITRYKLGCYRKNIARRTNSADGKSFAFIL